MELVNEMGEIEKLLVHSQENHFLEKKIGWLVCVVVFVLFYFVLKFLEKAKHLKLFGSISLALVNALFMECISDSFPKSLAGCAD